LAGSQEKTEKATDKKQRDARERGQIPKSKELVSVGILFAGAASVFLSGGLFFSHFRRLLEDFWGRGFQSISSLGADSEILHVSIFHLSIMLLPTFLSLMAVAFGLNLIQTKGLLFTTETIKPKFSHLSPLEGFKRLFSIRSFVELIKSIVKLVIVGCAVYWVLHDERESFLLLPDLELTEVLATLNRLIFKVVLQVSGIMLLVSLLDLYFQRWQHGKDLKMTKQEVKEEHKQSEGDQHVKARIRSIQRTLTKQRMLAKVPKATMVVTNPTHIAVALHYDQGMEAPTVVAKGVDFLAKKIIKVARKHGVPVTQNPPLARALYKQVKLDETIPLTLYRAVAKVLAYVYQQQRRTPR